jgi:putative membrane protein insertion efficiency factor
MKKSVTSLIKIYQCIAPARMRDCCRFEPSCSNYMIQTIQKYGIVVGVTKGINRLLRCYPPNGGLDKP